MLLALNETQKFVQMLSQANPKEKEVPEDGSSSMAKDKLATEANRSMGQAQNIREFVRCNDQHG